MKNIREITKVVRTKNCSPFELTIDIIFLNKAFFEAVRDKDLINCQKIAELYNLPPEKVFKVIYFPPSNAVKVTMARERPSGTPGDSDVYGAQQHAPLLELDFDI